jgi:hypothetical protein
MAQLAPRATVNFYSRELCCEPPGFGPGTRWPAGIIADIRKLLTFEFLCTAYTECYGVMVQPKGLVVPAESGAVLLRQTKAAN